MNQELPDVQAGFRKGRRTRDQIANIHWIVQKAREFQKNIYYCFIHYTKAFDLVNHNKRWKTLQEMGIPDHLLTSWEICMQVKKQQLEPNVEQWSGSKLGMEYKEVRQGCILSPWLFNLYAEYIMKNAGLDEA